MRDDTVEAWRAELDAAAAIVADERVGADARQPGRPARDSGSRWPKSIFGKVVSQPVLNLIGLMLRRGRIEELPRLAAEFRRLDNARQGITLATATSAAPARPRTRSGP